MRIPSLSLVAAAALVLPAASACQESHAGTTGLSAPSYDGAFWSHWGDGHAELASYDLVIPRYGTLRKGTAVAIFVTEDFSKKDRIKADPGRPASDILPVIKLNLVQDFPTGVYDYNVMTSAFVALGEGGGRGAGQPTKVSFTGQEWCGHVYHHVLFGGSEIEETLHSYFDGEADFSGKQQNPEDGVSEDALYLWARGLAAPQLAPGESTEVSLLPSLTRTRFKHVKLRWTRATLSHEKATQKLSVPAGEFEVYKRSAKITDGPTVDFYVETAKPHRLISWRASDGTRADMLAAKRMKYWQMNGPGGIEALKQLGLKAREARTP